VKPFPDYEAPSQTTARYYPGAADGSRAGYFMVNTYRLDARPQAHVDMSGEPGMAARRDHSEPIFPISGVTATTPRISKAGRSTPKASGRNWDSTGIRIQRFRSTHL
jgi:hypothetical protein